MSLPVPPFFAVLLLLAAVVIPLCRAEVLFTYENDRYELVASNATANEMLSAVEEVLDIPVERLPETGVPLTVHARSSDLEQVLSSFCESFVVLYTESAPGVTIPSGIHVTTSVDTVRQDAQYRSQTVRQHQLDRQMPVPPDLPLDYAGIGAAIRLAEDGSALWLRPLSSNAPAARCGIQLGDKILNIGGRLIQDFPDQAAITEAIRGPAGSPVQMLIQKPDGSLINQVIMREVISSSR